MTIEHRPLINSFPIYLTVEIILSIIPLGNVYIRNNFNYNQTFIKKPIACIKLSPFNTTELAWFVTFVIIAKGLILEISFSICDISYDSQDQFPSQILVHIQDIYCRRCPSYESLSVPSGLTD